MTCRWGTAIGYPQAESVVTPNRNECVATELKMFALMARGAHAIVSLAVEHYDIVA